MQRVAMLFGGCGGRVAEALTFAACAGALSVPEMRLMFIDPDWHDAHTTRAISLLDDYERIRALYEDSPSMGEFQTSFTVGRWPDHMPGGGSTLRQWSHRDADDALLMRALFTPATADRDMRRGFQGDQALATTVLMGLLAEAETDPEDALHRLTQELAGEDAQIVLVGSVSGGTGGAGIPAVAAYLRERLGERAHLSAVLLLPYGVGEKASTAKAALRRYGLEGFDMPVCLLGLPEGARHAELADAARLNEWLAVHALDWLMRHDASDHAAYTYRAEKAGLTWNIFGREEALFRTGYIRLMKTAAIFRLTLTEELTRRFTRPAALRDRLSGWYAACCREALGLDDAERQELMNELRALTSLLDGAWAWMEQITATLPLQLRYADVLADVLEAASTNEQAIADLSGQLDVLTREAVESGVNREMQVYREAMEEDDEADLTQSRLTAIQSKLQELVQAQEPLNRHLGGRETVDMLNALLTQCRNEAESVREQEKEARRRIEQAEAVATPQEQHRILTARTKLKPMQRHLAMQDGRIARVQRDLEAAREGSRPWEGPAIAGEDLPSLGLFSQAAMESIRTATQNGERRKDQKQRMQQAVADFTALAIMPGEDHATIKRVLQGLSKVRAEEEHPLACLLSRTMALVLEEDA